MQGEKIREEYHAGESRDVIAKPGKEYIEAETT